MAGRSLTLGEVDSPLLQAALERVAHHCLVVGDGHAQAHAGALVDLRAAPRERRYLGHYLLHVRRHRNPLVGVREAHILLLHYLDLLVERPGIVRAYLRPEPVLQRRNYPAAVGVVLRVRAGHQHHVQRQHDAVALYLDVTLLHQVEQAHLDALGQVGQLVYAEDAPVGARNQPVVDGQLIGQVAPLGDLDRIDLAYQVGHRDVRRRQLLGVAFVARHPLYGRAVAVLLDALLAGRADGSERVAVQLAARHHRNLVVQQRHQAADEPRLRLAPLAEQDYVLAREHCVLQLRNHALVEAHYPRKQVVRLLDLANEVLADLLLHGLYGITAAPQLAYGARFDGAFGHIVPPVHAGVQGRARPATRAMILRTGRVCQFRKTPLSPAWERVRVRGPPLPPNCPFPLAGLTGVCLRRKPSEKSLPP